MDQSGETRRALGVADLRLDGTDYATARSRPPGLEQPGQRLDFDHVADGRACPMGFDVADRRGIDPCLGIGSFERPHLTLVARRSQSSATAIAGGADPLNDRVDPITVALGVGQTLENDGSDSFADHDAIGASVEGTTVTPRGKGLRLA